MAFATTPRCKAVSAVFQTPSREHLQTLSCGAPDLLTADVNQSSQFSSPSSMCHLVTLVPQPTLYRQAGFAMTSSSPFKLDSDWMRHAVFLPVIVDILLATILVLSGFGTAALAHSVTANKTLSEQFQKAIEYLAESFASLRGQSTSGAQVVLQNHGPPHSTPRRHLHVPGRRVLLLLQQRV